MSTNIALRAGERSADRKPVEIYWSPELARRSREAKVAGLRAVDPAIEAIARVLTSRALARNIGRTIVERVVERPNIILVSAQRARKAAAPILSAVGISSVPGWDQHISDKEPVYYRADESTIDDPSSGQVVHTKQEIMQRAKEIGGATLHGPKIYEMTVPTPSRLPEDANNPMGNLSEPFLTGLGQPFYVQDNWHETKLLSPTSWSGTSTDKQLIALRDVSLAQDTVIAVNNLGVNPIQPILLPN